MVKKTGSQTADNHKKKIGIGTLERYTGSEAGGIKTKESSKKIFESYMQVHIECGIDILRKMRDAPRRSVKFHW